VKDKFFLFYLLTQRKILVYILLVLFIVPSSSASGEESAQGSSVKLEPVIVTSSRIHSGDQRLPIRSQDTIVLEKDETVSHFSIPSILKEFSLTDVRTRGPYGVQADISLRGAPFEENLVLFEGISLNDPKSGHHNMDLPFTLYDVKRIDITHGPASSAYGSGALGGAINFVPRKPGDKIGFFASSSTGWWDFYSGLASLNVPLGPLKSRASVEWKRSTGFAPETEFDTLTASSFSRVEADDAELDVFMGYLTKKFGAGSFYSSRYPDEEESINTGLFIAKGRMEKGNISVAPSFYFKRLQDKFILDRNRPSFSRSDHTTYLYGGEVNSEIRTSFGNLVLGGLLGKEEVSSTSLGGHSRLKNSAFLEYEGRILNLILNGSFRTDCYSTFGSYYSPSANIAYEVFPAFLGEDYGNHELSVRAGIARSFRAPTFTELYYSSPANRGNSELKPETAWSYEAGLDYATYGINVKGTAFLRNTENIIDWTKESPSSSVWQSENIGEFDIWGLEGSLAFDFQKLLKTPLKKIALRYAYLEGLDKKGITSKYVLEYLKHNLGLNLEYELPFGLTQEFSFSFRKRIGSEKYFLLDSTINKDVKFETGKASFFINFSNIFNTEYTEQGDIKMPGFAAYCGASVEF